MRRVPTVTGIDHIALLAQDVERTTQFYVDVLGLHIIDHRLGDEPAAVGQVWLGDDRSRFIAVTEASDGQAGALGIGTIHHVALRVASFDALLKWKRWLQHKQVLVVGPYDQQAYQDIVFTDPDGVLLEIATEGPGWEATQDGRDVFAPPKESMAPYRDEDEISRQTWPQPVTEIEPDMALRGLHHVSSIASSLEETDRFYREMLGLPLVRRSLDHDDPEVEHWYWGLDGGRPGTVVSAFPIVHPRERRKSISGRAGVGVAEHFALAVGMDEMGLRDLSAQLADQESEVPSDSADRPRSIAVQSPDGLAVELVATDHESVTGGDLVSERKSRTETEGPA